jgi:iron complex outermembrane recepter protein
MDAKHAVRSRSPARRRTALPVALVLGLSVGSAHAQQAGDRQLYAALPRDLTELSLEDLLNIEVISVTKRTQRASESAAAVGVLTGEEIRRSGARSIVEALRLMPGLQVARSGTHSYNVMSRGFSSDKLEVLLDGRSVYTPLTSTVFWEVLDTYLPDIDRIEVIRGPGGTLYGANAMNGVINIITKHSADTTGTEVLAGAGNEERAFGGISTGSAIGQHGHVRIFAQAYERDPSVRADGSEAFDGGGMSQAGFRSDWTPARGHTLLVAGGLYDAVHSASSIASPGTRVENDRSGGHLQAGWGLELAEGHQLQVAGYYDRYKLDFPELFSETRDTVQVALEHDLPAWGRHHVIWGLGYRHSRDKTGGPPNAIVFAPESRALYIASAFVQDQMRLWEGGELTIGSKFEHNDITGFEIQPGVRLGWNINPRHFTWASAARAVRTPNRIDSDVAIFCSPALEGLGLCAPANANFRIGNQDLKSEKLIAYEWGWRYHPFAAAGADLALFFNDYSDIRSTETSPPPFGSFENNLEGESFGGELALSWQPWDWLRLQPFYSYLKLDLRAKPGSTDSTTAGNLEGNSAQQMAGLRFGTGPWAATSVTGFLRYIDRLPNQSVPAYTELNLRVSHRLLRGLDLALVGENLLDRSHPEYGANPSTRAENQRSVFLEVHWTWQ